MTQSQALSTILNAVSDHEDARITRGSMVTIIEHTLKEYHDAAYDKGYSLGVTDADLDPDADLDEEIAFEADIDLDELRGTDDDAL